MAYRRMRIGEGNWLVNDEGKLIGMVTTGGEEVLWPIYATDTSGNVTGLVGPDGVEIPLNQTMQNAGYSLEQPARMNANVNTFGKLAAHFGGSIWAVSGGSPVLTTDYTGWDGSGAKTGITSRTGQPTMLKVVPAANTTEEIRLTTIGNMLTQNLGGKLGLWVYVESLPGYQVGGTLNASMNIDISTTTLGTNAMYIGFNTNQIREGWNFLKFVQRDPTAYLSGATTTEYHPFGVTATAFGTGADTNLVSGTVNRLRINWVNMSGATLYFDSIWTDFSSTAQVVFGNDGGVGLLEYGKPVFDSYGWVGYTAFPYNASGTHARVADLNSNVSAIGAALYAAGWDFVNHTVNHPSLGTLSSEAQIAYEVETARAWQYALGLYRGAEFYASPASSSSRLSESVIRQSGFKLQRHSRKYNVSPTPWGIDNPHFVGSIDMGSVSSLGVSSISGTTTTTIAGWQTASKLMRVIDVIEDYGDTIFPFWHGITKTGDSGSGEDLTGDNLLLTRSAFELFCAYVRARELAGGLMVCRGMTGFYYGA